MTIRNLLREPLLHFFVLSGLLFSLYSAMNRDAFRAPDEVVVDQLQLDAIAARFEETWQRAPSSEELQHAVDAWVREEILYREGLAAGLDRDDIVVRRRIVQKMQFINDGMATASSPTDAELQAWLDAHPDAYRIDPRYALDQVFFDPQRHREDLDSVVQRAVAELAANPQSRVGDTTLLPPGMPLVERSEIVRVFGERFADALDDLPVGRWAGPIRSGYGVHLVRIDRREPSRLPTIDEARAELERDLSKARSDEAAERAYAALRKRYRVRIEGDLAAAVERPGDAAAATGVEQARP